MNISDIDLDKNYTYADYLKWTFKETVELIRGRIFKMSAPLSNHQKVSGNIFNLFENYLGDKNCVVFASPFDVRLPKPLAHRKSDTDIETVVQPDICVVCDLTKIDRRGCNGAPDLIAEVLSKATATHDFKDKFEVYEESGVKEYWIVDTELKTVTVYRLSDKGKYVADYRQYLVGDTIRVGVLDGLDIPVANVFRKMFEFEE